MSMSLHRSSSAASLKEDLELQAAIQLSLQEQHADCSADTKSPTPASLLSPSASFLGSPVSCGLEDCELGFGQKPTLLVDASSQTLTAPRFTPEPSQTLSGPRPPRWTPEPVVLPTATALSIVLEAARTSSSSAKLSDFDDIEVGTGVDEIADAAGEEENAAQDGADEGNGNAAGFEVGDRVAYRSNLFQAWMPASVKAVVRDPSTGAVLHYDLCIKRGVKPNRVRSEKRAFARAWGAENFSGENRGRVLSADEHAAIASSSAAVGDERDSECFGEWKPELRAFSSEFQRSPSVSPARKRDGGNWWELPDLPPISSLLPRPELSDASDPRFPNPLRSPLLKSPVLNQFPNPFRSPLLKSPVLNQLNTGFLADDSSPLDDPLNHATADLDVLLGLKAPPEDSTKTELNLFEVGDRCEYLSKGGHDSCCWLGARVLELRFAEGNFVGYKLMVRGSTKFENVRRILRGGNDLSEGGEQQSLGESTDLPADNSTNPVSVTQQSAVAVENALGTEVVAGSTSAPSQEVPAALHPRLPLPMQTVGSFFRPPPADYKLLHVPGIGLPQTGLNLPQIQIGLPVTQNGALFGGCGNATAPTVSAGAGASGPMQAHLAPPAGNDVGAPGPMQAHLVPPAGNDVGAPVPLPRGSRCRESAPSPLPRGRRCVVETVGAVAAREPMQAHLVPPAGKEVGCRLPFPAKGRDGATRNSEKEERFRAWQEEDEAQARVRMQRTSKYGSVENCEPGDAVEYWCAKKGTWLSANFVSLLHHAENPKNSPRAGGPSSSATIPMIPEQFRGITLDCVQYARPDRLRAAVLPHGTDRLPTAFTTSDASTQTISGAEILAKKLELESSGLENQLKEICRDLRGCCARIKRAELFSRGGGESTGEASWRCVTCLADSSEVPVEKRCVQVSHCSCFVGVCGECADVAEDMAKVLEAQAQQPRDLDVNNEQLQSLKRCPSCSQDRQTVRCKSVLDMCPLEHELYGPVGTTKSAELDGRGLEGRGGWM